MGKFNFNEHCLKRLFAEFPKLRDDSRYKKIIDDALTDKQHGAHGVYESVFCSYVLDMINTENTDETKKIKRAFNLIEELIGHESLEVRCIAKVGFIEPFISKLKPTKDIPRYLGLKSLKAAKDLCETFIKINPITWEKEF